MFRKQTRDHQATRRLFILLILYFVLLSSFTPWTSEALTDTFWHLCDCEVTYFSKTTHQTAFPSKWRWQLKTKQIADDHWWWIVWRHWSQDISLNSMDVSRSVTSRGPEIKLWWESVGKGGWVVHCEESGGWVVVFKEDCKWEVVGRLWDCGSM